MLHLPHSMPVVWATRPTLAGDQAIRYRRASEVWTRHALTCAPPASVPRPLSLLLLSRPRRLSLVVASAALDWVFAGAPVSIRIEQAPLRTRQPPAPRSTRACEPSLARRSLRLCFAVRPP